MRLTTAAEKETFGKYQSHGGSKAGSPRDLTVVNNPLTMEQMPDEFPVTLP
ncbi:hypothetical protein LAUMK42_03457 [Mycobacterium persicum]|uniref:Uncharacterized protein n=1 Tax=Mycobacterium persicum TaxID=1487726 RepID=A0AB38UVA9_9MYCO|nr:hypothetical protein LAUMK42_03457 [Mycobacterium persicum]